MARRTCEEDGAPGGAPAPPAALPASGTAAGAAPAPAGYVPHGDRGRARVFLFWAGVLFGLSAVLARLATLGGMSGGQVTLVRFALGTAFVAGLFAVKPGTFRPRRKLLLLSRGAFGGVAALLYFVSIQHIPAGEATLLNNTFPIWAVLLSLLLLDERPTLHLAIALLLASAGVFLVLGGGGLALGLGWGEAAGILSAMMGGAAVTSIRALRATDNAFTIFFAFALGGLLVSLPYALQAWQVTPAGWLAAAGVGVVAFAAQLLMTEAYGALSVPEAALWQQLTPIMSYLWALTIGEAIGWATVVGVLLGVAGVVYGSVLGHRPREASSREARLASGLPAEEP